MPKSVWERIARSFEIDPAASPEEAEERVSALAERLAAAYPDPERQEWMRRAVWQWAQRRTR